jgi:trehalose 6-phosphate phosphatase
MTPNRNSDVKIAQIPDFWPRFRKSKSRFLALDYDGTLAPFRAERMEAYPLAGIRELLECLGESGNTSLAIISGRPIAELLTLLPVSGIMLIGSHGFEQMKPGGQIVTMHPGPHQLTGLRTAEEKAGRLGFRLELETKVASVAFHTRKMAPHEAKCAEDLIYGEWARLASFELECRRFDGGVEIRASGSNKGAVLQELLSELPPETFSVFVGDDETDEDAFRALRGQGIGIKVGRPGVSTMATGFLPNCEAVRDFLGQWLSIIFTEEV